MNKLLVSIFDKLAGVHSAIHTVTNAAVAVRDFADAVNTVGNALNKHPDDYILQIIGEVDEETSEVKNYAENVLLTTARDALATNGDPNIIPMEFDEQNPPHRNRQGL